MKKVEVQTICDATEGLQTICETAERSGHLLRHAVSSMEITRCIMAFHGTIENGVERHGPCDDRVRLIDSRNNAFFRGIRERSILSRDPRKNPRNNRAFFRGSRNNELPNGSWIEPASQIEVCLSHVLVRASSVSGPYRTAFKRRGSHHHIGTKHQESLGANYASCSTIVA